jgi:hypothetical protein
LPQKVGSKLWTYIVAPIVLGFSAILSCAPSPELVFKVHKLQIRLNRWRFNFGVVRIGDKWKFIIGESTLRHDVIIYNQNSANHVPTLKSSSL